MNHCTCKISHTPCASIVIYDESGYALGEHGANLVPYLKTKYTFKCIGKHLQDFNAKITKENKQ